MVYEYEKSILYITYPCRHMPIRPSETDQKQLKVEDIVNIMVYREASIFVAVY